MYRLSASLLQAFVHSRRGNVAVTFTLVLIPLMLAVGLYVDFDRASNERATMQAALDAALMAALLEPADTSAADRQTKLNAFYAGNDGHGTAKITNIAIDAGSTSMEATASYDMPTSFMALGNISTVEIGVLSEVSAPLKPTEATFKFQAVWGIYSKDIILKGKNGTTIVDLMKMEYRYSSTGYSIKMLVRQANGTFRESYKQECALPSGNCTKTGDPSVGVKTQDYSDAYLQFTVLNGQPGTFNSNDASQASRMFISNYPVGTIPSLIPRQVQQTTATNMLDIVPCGQESKQSWEDGGTARANWSGANADFHYTVTGKCEIQPDQGIRYTQ